MATHHSPPNVVLIVLDCARWEDSWAGRTPNRPMPFVESLLRESESYPQTVAPSPWTIPSHASLFTGLYPWEHGCHAKSNLRLDGSIPRIASVLRDSGYRTFSVSANHLLCPDLGMVEGFQEVGWAGWWEPYLRLGGVPSPPNASGARAPTEASPGFIDRSGPLWKLIKRSSRMAYRYPFLLDGAGRLASALRAPSEEHAAPVSAWIEPTLERWVARAPKDVPVFGFVNLLENHEPYYPDTELASGFATWWRLSRHRQDHVGWLAGRWEPTREEYDRLRELYRRTYLAADRRVRRIVQILQSAGRWENTLLILTSDHGQAFGEDDLLFHMLRLPEATTRVPLIVRRPDEGTEGSVAKGWASLVDIVPTILQAVDQPGALSGSGVRLESLLDEPRAGPVYSVADGLVWHTIVPDHERANLSERRLAHFDRVLSCAYRGDTKVHFDLESGALRAYDIAKDPEERHDLWSSLGASLEPLAESARDAARRMVLHAPSVASPDVEERLRSWGYI